MYGYIQHTLIYTICMGMCSTYLYTTYVRVYKAHTYIQHKYGYTQPTLIYSICKGIYSHTYTAYVFVYTAHLYTPYVWIYTAHTYIQHM